MSKFVLSLVFGGAMALTAASAQAFPSAPSGAMSIPSAEVIQVAGGCGPGWHRGPGGACRPNRGPVVVVPAPRAVVVVPGPRAVVVAPRPRCWWTAGPRGRVRVCR